jgi:hypothetical protein
VTPTRAALIALLVLLAGCSAPVTAPTASGDPSPASDWSWPDDPPDDRLGWENGYWYNESIDVDQADGLNESELDAYVGRTMARVEHIRQLEFTEPVPVDVVSREEFRESGAIRDESDTETQVWNDQVWEALLLVGEDRTVSSVFDELYGGAVQGYYSSDEGEIVVVSDAGEPSIDRGTLAHELLHALQDQQFGLPDAGRTQDVQLARNGLVEGDARYVERLYQERCAGDWECVPNPPRGGGGGSVDMGVYLTIYTPYSEGPTFVHSLYQRGGWDAVNAAYDELPVSTEQILHPDAYPDETPRTVRVPDRSSDSWSRFDHRPRADTVGEASLFTMLWDVGAVGQRSLTEDPGPYSSYNYQTPASVGWAGDSVVPYRSEDGEFGYVFRIAFDTPDDAREFETRYRKYGLQMRLLAKQAGPNTYVVESGPFADAFRVTRSGDTVTIVNAPTVEQLDDVHRG